MRSHDLMTLFAEDFDGPAGSPTMPPTGDAPLAAPPPSYGQAELEAACAQARSEGRAEGIADASVSHAAGIAAALARIADQMAAAADHAARVIDEHADAFAKLLFATMAAGFPLLRTDHGEAELRAVIRSALPGMLQEAHVTLRVHPSMVAVVEQELAGVPPREQQHMTIEPSEAIAVGDVAIAWPNGGAVRDTEKIHRAISEILGPLGLLPTPVTNSTDTNSR